MATMLNKDPDMIERMEVDLATKAATAMNGASIPAGVYGVFSLDDLEHKNESELCNKIGVGVGYAGAEPTALETNSKAQLNVGSSNAVKAVDFIFQIILAVPSGVECAERYSATKLLTLLRLGIMGSKASGDATNRTWAFVRESPRPIESTDTMLYYSQVWRVVLLVEGPV